MKKLSLWGMALAAGAACWLSAHGCGGSSGPTASSGGTGAFGIVTVGGKQLLYYPNKTPLPPPDLSGDGYISVIDVGQKGNGTVGANALVTTIDLGTSDMATTTAGNSSVVVAAGTHTYDVWFIDPSSNTILKTLQLPPWLNGNGFSGGGGIVTGIAIDNTNNRAILSVWDGFLFIDLGKMEVTGSVLSAPSENFGFDDVHEMIVNPFADCGSLDVTGDGGTDAGFCDFYQSYDAGTITAGLNVIKLGTTNEVYTYENPNAQDPTEPLGTTEPDSAAIDPSTMMAAVPPEFVSQEEFLDLSKASYDSANMTFTAPLIVVSMDQYDGVAIEPTTHLAFFEQEFADAIALVDMTKLSDDAGLGPLALVESELPSPPGTGASWANLGDPHGIAVTTGLSTNGPVGFVVDDDGSGNLWVARINLTQMLSLGADAGTLSSSALGPALTLLNGAAKE